MFNEISNQTILILQIDNVETLLYILRPVWYSSDTVN